MSTRKCVCERTSSSPLQGCRPQLPCRSPLLLFPKRSRRTCAHAGDPSRDSLPQPTQSTPAGHNPQGHESPSSDAAKQARRNASSFRRQPQDLPRSRTQQQLPHPTPHARPPSSSGPGGPAPPLSGVARPKIQQPSASDPHPVTSKVSASVNANPLQPLAAASQQPGHPPPPPPSLQLLLSRLQEPGRMTSLVQAGATAAAAVVAAASTSFHLPPRSPTSAPPTASPGQLAAAGAQLQPWASQDLSSSPGGVGVGSPLPSSLSGYATTPDLGPAPGHITAGGPDGHAAMEALGSDGGLGLAQLVEGASAGRDPAAAAEKLQAFVLQYRGRYSEGAAARIDATASRLQAFVDAARRQPRAGGGGGSDVAAAQVLEGQYGSPGPLELAAVSPVLGSPPDPQYHDYVMDGVLGALHRVQQLLLPPGGPAAGNPAGAGAAGGGQGQQLTSAADTLRGLADQLRETQRLYTVPDPEERGSLSMLSAQLSSIADKLAAAGPGVGQGGTMQQQVDRGWGPEAGGGAADPLLALLDGLYQAVVGQSGLRDFLLGVKRLGDSILSSMDGGWHTVPPAARLVAYVAALAGACFLIRNRLPELLGAGREDLWPSPAGGVASSNRASAAAQGAGGDLGPAPQGRSAAAASPPLPSHEGGRTLVRGPDGRTPQAARGDDPWLTGVAGGRKEAAAGGGPSGPATVVGGVRMVSLPREVDAGAAGHARGGVQAAWAAFRAASDTKGRGGADAGRGSGAGEAGEAAVAAGGNGGGGGSAAAAKREQQVLALKQHVSWATTALGPVMSVVPGGEAVRGELDGVLGALEEVDPSRGSPDSPDPLPDSALLGTWTLSYASNGPLPPSEAPSQPNLLAQLLQLADSVPGLGMEAVTHKLSRSSAAPNTISMENSTVFRFGPLGSWRVSVQGAWRDVGGGSADLDFHTFCLRPVAFLGLPVDDLPEVRVPVPELLLSRSTWRTTYLDTDMRINRSDAGAIFVFRRPEAVEGGARSQPQRTPLAHAASPYDVA